MDVDLSDDDLQRLPAADRREVNPPVQVDVASWSKAGQLDYWVNDWVNDRRGGGWAGSEVITVANGGSKLLICVQRAAKPAESIDDTYKIDRHFKQVLAVRQAEVNVRLSPEKPM
jgi:hypothetical protein